jgi:hypothetical protein
MFSKKVPVLLTEIQKFIEELNSNGKSIAIYGASHIPANVINYSYTSQFFDYSIDKQERKIGKFLPGSKLEVKPPSFLEENSPDYCFIAAIGNEEKIMSQHKKYLNNGGKFILCFPLRIVDQNNTMFISKTG